MPFTAPQAPASNLDIETEVNFWLRNGAAARTPIKIAIDFIATAAISGSFQSVWWEKKLAPKAIGAAIAAAINGGLIDGK